MGKHLAPRSELRDKLEALGVNTAQDTKEVNERLLCRAIAEGFFMNLAASNGSAKAGYLALQLKQSCTVHPSLLMIVLQESPKFVVSQELAQTRCAG